MLFVARNPLNTGVCIKFGGGGGTSKWQGKHSQTLWSNLGHEVVLKFLKCLFLLFPLICRAQSGLNGCSPQRHTIPV